MIYPCQRAQVQFQFTKEIGQHGKNSKVYLAHDQNLDGQVVIKQIDKTTFPHKDVFFEEARKLYKSYHPNVVQVLYACEDNDYIYISMPFYKNQSLKDLIDSRYLTAREVIKFATEFLSGLHNIHVKGLVHFDIKPDNIMLSDRMEALLSDFGLAESVDSSGLALQPCNYAGACPPEYIEAQFSSNFTFDRLFDIFQVGLTIYRMCCGNQVFQTQMSQFTTYQDLYVAIRDKKFPDMALIPEHIPSKVVSTIKKCISLNPNDRFLSALDVINNMADISDNFLDWEYSIDNRTRKWKKNDKKGNIYELSVDSTGSSTATKTTPSRTTRVLSYCLQNITGRQIKEFLSGID